MTFSQDHFTNNFQDPFVPTANYLVPSLSSTRVEIFQYKKLTQYLNSITIISHGRHRSEGAG
jgi:hypothetical protein